MSTTLTTQHDKTEITRAQSIGQTGEQSRAMAEIQSALTIAQHCPRDERRSIDRVLSACQRPGLAEKAEYCYSKGGTEIIGPTIDLLTVIANYWGNITFGFRELSQQNGESTVEAFAWDLESNSKRTVVFQVPHAITARGAIKRLTDPREVYELVANMAQRRVRACLEAIVPTDVVDDAVAQCRATLKESTPVNKETIGKLAKAFQEGYGVSVEQIEKRLGRRVDTMTSAQMVSMRKIYSSIKDGMSTVESWFPPIEEKEEAGTGLKERMKAKAATKKPAPAVEPEIDDEAEMRAEAARHEAAEASGELFGKGQSTYE
jgi:hypothetical protein